MRIARSLVLILTVAATACGGHQHTAGGAPGGGGAAAGSGVAAGGGGGGGGAADGAGAAAGGAAADDAPLSRDECAAMLGRVIDLGWAEQKRTLPADQVPTDEQIAAIRAKMIAQHTDECLALPRAEWRCAMAAKDAAALVACQQAADAASGPPAP